jgi:5-methylcytosine-specific restriction endonuclease McrA
LPYKDRLKHNEQTRRDYWKHREKRIEAKRKSRRANLEKSRAMARFYRQKHIEKVKRYSYGYNRRPDVKRRRIPSVMNWIARHPHKVMEYWKKMNTRLGFATGGLHYKKYHAALYAWSKAVRKVTGNYCKICFSTAKLEVHHLFSKTQYPELSLNINNGIVLCRDHHKERNLEFPLVTKQTGG